MSFLCSTSGCLARGDTFGNTEAATDPFDRPFNTEADLEGRGLFIRLFAGRSIGALDRFLGLLAETTPSADFIEAYCHLYVLLDLQRSAIADELCICS